MNLAAQQPDRRKQKRYNVVNGAYAVVQPGAAKLGQIRNISLGGLSFKYIASETRNNAAQNIDILIGKHNFHLKQIPVKSVFDMALEKESPFSTVCMRQQAVQFKDLTEEQAAQLKHLLQHHTTSET